MLSPSERIEELEEEVRQLKEALYGTDTLPTDIVSALTAQQRRILACLVRRRGVVRSVVLELAAADEFRVEPYSRNLLNVQMKRIRDALGGLGVVILTYRGQGYMLTDKSRGLIEYMTMTERMAA